MIEVLTTLNRAYGAMLKVWGRIVIFDYVYAYASSRQNVERLNAYVFELESVLRPLVERVRDTLSDAPYPFAPAGVQKTVSGYLRGREVTTEDLGAVLHDARAHTGLFFELYWRVVGELALIVEQVEASPPPAG